MIDNPGRVTGTDLVLLRTARGVQQAAIAKAWPCSRQNIARVEASRRPTRAAVRRYIAALQAAEAAE